MCGIVVHWLEQPACYRCKIKSKAKQKKKKIIENRREKIELSVKYGNNGRNKNE